MVLCARCHLDALLVVRHDLLPTSPCVECCALVIRRGFFCNILVCRRSTACAFICQCHWGSYSTPSFWILSCTLDENIAQAPLHCCHRHLFYLVLIALLLPLLRGISPVYSTEHIPKYSSIENFMKLPFQRVVIRFKRSPNEGVMPVSLLALRAVQKFSECTTFNVLAIPACRNL